MIEIIQDQLDQERATDEGMPERQAYASRKFVKSPSWEDIQRYADSLAEMIIKSGFDPDIVVGIQRGGFMPAAMLAYRLNKPLGSIEVIKEGESRRIGRLIGVNLKELNGKRVVLTEDMFETGTSAQTGRDKLEQHGAEVRLACFYTRLQTEIEPDFVLARNVDVPITFPWEREG